MSKLKLSLQNIEGAEILSREQLKNVLGGWGIDPGSGYDAGCSVTCNAGYYACCNQNGSGGSPTCECFNSGSPTCESGGTGSSSCSVSN
jgi:hypothetical protein